MTLRWKLAVTLIEFTGSPSYGPDRLTYYDGRDMPLKPQIATMRPIQGSQL